MKLHPALQLLVALGSIFLSYHVEGYCALVLAAACWSCALSFRTTNAKIVLVLWMLVLLTPILMLLNVRELLDPLSRSSACASILTSLGRIATILGAIALLLLTIEAEELYAYLARLGVRSFWLIVALRPLFVASQMRWRIRQALLAVRLANRNHTGIAGRMMTLRKSFQRTVIISFLELEEASLSLEARGLVSGRVHCTLLDTSLKPRHIAVFVTELAVLSLAMAIVRWGLC